MCQVKLHKLIRRGLIGLYIFVVFFNFFLKQIYMLPEKFCVRQTVGCYAVVLHIYSDCKDGNSLSFI